MEYPHESSLRICDEIVTKFPHCVLMIDICSTKDFEGKKKSLSMCNPLPVILVVVWSDASGFEWSGFLWIQFWFCCGWVKTHGVVETVTMMIQVIRRTLFLESSPFVLYISPFCSLQSHSSILGCIDGWVEMKGQQRVTSAWLSHTVKYLSVLRILLENTWRSEHEIFWREQPKKLQQEEGQLWKHQPSTEENQKCQCFACPGSL